MLDPRPLRRTRLTMTSALLTMSALTACGSTGTNGVATKPVSQIITAAKEAVGGASTVHVTGDLGRGAQHITLDLRLAKGKGASGTVVISGQTLELLRVGQDVYLKGDAQFYQSVVGLLAAAPAATASAGTTPTAPTATASGPAGAGAGNSFTVQAMQGKYLHVGPTDVTWSTFASITDPASLVDQILVGTGPLTKDGQKNIRGTKAIVLTGSPVTTKVFVGIDGPAYLLEVLPTGGGTLNFLDYGSPVALNAPPAGRIVEISKIPVT